MIFDRDDAGQDGMGKCLPKGSFKEGVKNTKTYINKDSGIIYLMNIILQKICLDLSLYYLKSKILLKIKNL